MKGKQVLQDKYLKAPEIKNLRAARNRLLVCRYYYYSELKKLRYDAVLERLMNEFFLSVRTIQNILLEYSELLGDLYNSDPNRGYFKRAYPYLCWT